MWICRNDVVGNALEQRARPSDHGIRTSEEFAFECHRLPHYSLNFSSVSEQLRFEGWNVVLWRTAWKWRPKGRTQQIQIEIGPYVAVLVLGFALVHSIVTFAMNALLNVIDRQPICFDHPLVAILRFFHLWKNGDKLYWQAGDVLVWKTFLEKIRTKPFHAPKPFRLIFAMPLNIAEW